MTVFESRVITKKLAEFEGNANKMLHFDLNYMKPFEIIQGDIEIFNGTWTY